MATREIFAGDVEKVCNPQKFSGVCNFFLFLKKRPASSSSSSSFAFHFTLSPLVELCQWRNPSPPSLCY